ncbi:hypothetical protein BJX99DRAFT_221665 [Aspergillus californicus]
MSPDSKKVDYLAPYTQLSPCIYTQEPDTSAEDTGDYPPTILIAFWMNASSRALVKYVAQYRRLAPRAKIIFIRTASSEFILRPTKRAQYARLAPAVEALQASSPKESPVFTHMFSNGGVFATTYLLEAYQKATGHSLLVSSTVIDSAPGIATLKASIRAFSYILPKQWILRLLGKVLLYTYLGTMLMFGAVLNRVFGVRDAVRVTRQLINDPRIMAGSGLGSRSGSGQGSPPHRCYIYSEADELVDYRDVESHAADAEAKGFVVRREKFLGSPHVAHMMVDSERYWDVVKLYLKMESGVGKTGFSGR